MECLSTVSFWLLVCCMWSNGAAEALARKRSKLVRQGHLDVTEHGHSRGKSARGKFEKSALDDMADIKEGISQIIKKLSVIEKRLTKLEELPREVHNVKVLMTSMTSMIQKSKAHPGSGTSEKHVDDHKKVVSGGSAAKPSGINVKVSPDHEPKSSQKKIKMVDPSSKAMSSLILASTKKVFLSNFPTKTWKEIPMTPHPDSLLYDDVHRRLYWVTKKPGAVGFFTGKDWKSQDVYRTKGDSLGAFAFDDEVEGFVVNKSPLPSNMILRKNGETIKQLQVPPFPKTPSDSFAVNASTQTVFVSRQHPRGFVIAKFSYAKQGNRPHITPITMIPGRIRFATFDKHSSSVICSDGKKLIHTKLDGKKRPEHRPFFMFPRKSHPKPDVICPEEIQMLTSSKDHLYAFGKKNVYVYNRQFQLVETLLLPDLKEDKMKTAAAVNMES